MPRRCIHCNGPATAPSQVCGSCLDLLSALGEEDEEPQPQPALVAPHKPGRFELSQEDIEAYEAMSAAGSFRQAVTR